MSPRPSRHPVSAAWREVVVRTGAARTDRALAAAARSGEPLLLGPFVGEIGYELEYWIPFLRRALGEHGIPPEQATVMTRGGASLWYRDFAAGELDVLSLVSPEDYYARLEERRATAGDLKQLRWEPLDRELVRLAHERLGDLVVVHPTLMFTRLRGLWFKGDPIDRHWPSLDYRRIADVDPLPGMPERYVAVKAYFNEVLPPTEANRSAFRSAVARIAEHVDVVLLSTGLQVDDHEEWDEAEGRVHRIEHLLRPEDNLAVQTRIIAGARGLVATYGGFSYLGAFLGVPTLTFYEVEQTVPVHLEVLRRAVPGAAYERVTVDPEAAASFAAGLA